MENLKLNLSFEKKVGYKNPENIKTISLNLNLNNDRTQGAFEFVGTVQTKSQSGSVKNRLEAVYTSIYSILNLKTKLLCFFLSFLILLNRKKFRHKPKCR